jgi:hypothetical protein
MMDARANMDAMLRHLGWGQDLRDFPGTASERVALMRTARRRGLIAWRKARGRYELTSVGWSELMPRRRFSLASLILSTVTGAVVGAAALASIWAPADVSHHSLRRQSTASLHRLAKPIAVATEHPVDLGVGEAARPQVAVAPVATLAVAYEPTLDAAPVDPIEPTMVADGLLPEQPSAETAPIVAKQAPVKKPHHRTGLAWLSSNPRRVRQFRHSGYSSLGSQFAYR